MPDDYVNDDMPVMSTAEWQALVASRATEMPKRAKVAAEKPRQEKLFSGLECLPGQQDLFATDGSENL